MLIYVFKKSCIRNLKKEEIGKIMLDIVIFYLKVSKDILVMMYILYIIKFYLFKRRVILYVVNVFKIYIYFCYEVFKKNYSVLYVILNYF